MNSQATCKEAQVREAALRESLVQACNVLYALKEAGHGNYGSRAVEVAV